jgi:alpha-amylase/alpha-mannosidase (GH57 family)
MRWSNFFHIYQPPAWDEAIIRRACTEAYEPLAAILEAHPNVHITLNITGALIEQLVALGLDGVLRRFKTLAERGQIEFVGSAKYHPILTLIIGTFLSLYFASKEN